MATAIDGSACQGADPCLKYQCKAKQCVSVGSAPNGTACSDNNKCTLTDTCQAGQCVGSNTLTCNDNNICTDDFCSPTLGCQYPKLEAGVLNVCGGCGNFFSPTPSASKGAPCSAGSGKCKVTGTYQCASTNNAFFCKTGGWKTDGLPVDDDSNPCTLDVCKGGQETHTPKTGGICQMNGKPGMCADGVCNTTPCGNGVVDANEQCDGKLVLPHVEVQYKYYSLYDNYQDVCKVAGYGGGLATCSATCKVNLSGCYGGGGDPYGNPPTNPLLTQTDVCGNWMVEAGEVCDHGNAGGKTCIDFGYYGGELKCADDCQKFVKTGCFGTPGNPYGGVPTDPDYVPACGNQTVDPGEECEQQPLGFVTATLGKGYVTCANLGFFGGTVSCKACTLNTTACYGAPGDPYGGTQHCGDNALNVGEECDGTQLSGKTCADFGYYGGWLKCSACKFDKNSCYGDPGNPYGQPSDPTLPVTCGNGVVDAKEQCDGMQMLPTKGAYYVENNDGCQIAGYYSGAATCTPACKVDLSGCHGNAGDPYGTPPTNPLLTQTDVCGNWMVDNGEVCDHGNVGGKTCKDFGYYGGALECSGDCQKLVKTGCFGTPGNPYGGVPTDPDYVPACGNLTVDPGEECEQQALGFVTATLGKQYAANCANYGFFGGTASCSACTVVTKACYGAPGDPYGGTQHCGDGVLNAGEECDGAKLAGQTCAGLGYYGGWLKCTNCKLNKYGCYSTPGNPYGTSP